MINPTIPSLAGITSAREVIHELGIQEPPIAPMYIAKRLQIEVKEQELKGQIEGCALKGPGFAGIILDTRIRYEPRKRFTLAHEIGHCRINSHKGSSYTCLGGSIGMPSTGQNKEETEANQFAAELLMPTGFFKPEAEEMEIGLDTIEYLAQRYGTSLTSTAIRYVTFSLYACAMVISEDAKIKSFYFSDAFREDKRCYLQKGTPLQYGSIAEDIFTENPEFTTQLRYEDEIQASSWFLDIDDSDTSMFEESISLPQFKQVLSIIWIEQEESDEDYC